MCALCKKKIKIIFISKIFVLLIIIHKLKYFLERKILENILYKYKIKIHYKILFYDIYKRIFAMGQVPPLFED